jgi:hypothetical protein
LDLVAACIKLASAEPFQMVFKTNNVVK